MHHHHKRLHGGCKARWSLLKGIVFPIPPCGEKDYDKKERRAHHKGQHVLGYGNVHGALTRSGIHKLSVLIERVSMFFCMMRRKHLHALIYHYARQRNCHRLTLPLRYVPLILIPDVVEDNLRHIDLLKEEQRYEETKDHTSAQTVTVLS